MQPAASSFFRPFDWWTFWHFVQVQISRPFSSPTLRWEWLALAVGLLLATNPFVFPDRWVGAAGAWVRRYAERPWRAIWFCALLPMVIRAVLLPFAPPKPPSVHDEFSLLLLADTLRSGRLTNKAHLFWQHFETIHVIQQPTYSSMYPPGSGVFLALGILLGHPWIGVLLGMGVTCGAICWALQGWVSPTWSFAATVFAALQIGIGSFWINSYLGATALPALAGALVLGSIPRFFRNPSPALVVSFAVALVLFVNTRPYEGTVVWISSFGLVVYWYKRSTFGSVKLSSSLLAPAVAVLLLGATFTLYDSWRVTGSPFKTGYLLNRQTYGWPENLAYLAPVKVVSRHSNLTRMHEEEVGGRYRYSTLGQMVNTLFSRWFINWEFFFGPALTLPLLLLPWALRGSEIGKAVSVVLIVLAMNLLQLMMFPQYLSPVTSFIYLAVAAGLRGLWQMTRRTHFIAERICAGMLLCVVVGAGVSLFREPLGIPAVGFWEWPHWPYFRVRQEVQDKLESYPGKQLVIVRYGPDHFPDEEWVYNKANIDGSHIVWANSMGPEPDRKLRQYFRDRQAWLVEPDRDPSALLPLSNVTYGAKID